MNVPSTLVFSPQNQKFVFFGPVQETVSPYAVVTDASIVMTMYKGRIPGVTPGTSVAGATNISFTYENNGVYQASIGDASWTPELGEDYTTVFDLTSNTIISQHWEIKTVIQTRTK